MLASASVWIGVIGLTLFYLGSVLLYVPLVLLYAVGLWAIITASIHIIDESNFQRRMRRAKRFLHPHTAGARLARAGGTLIVEFPALGWQHARLWYTPDDVPAGAPVPPPNAYPDGLFLESTLAFVAWCHPRYTAPETGTALLLASRAGKRVAQRLQTRYPHLHCVEICTSPSPFEMQCGRAAEPPQTDDTASTPQ